MWIYGSCGLCGPFGQCGHMRLWIYGRRNKFELRGQVGSCGLCGPCGHVDSVDRVDLSTVWMC